MKTFVLLLSFAAITAFSAEDPAEILLWPNGALEAARAADAAGVGFCLSTMSTSSIEQAASAGKRPIWFQLYVFKDLGFAHAMIDRAKACGVSTLFVTVDLPYRGQRHADLKQMILPYPLEGRPEKELLEIGEQFYPKFLDMLGLKR